MWTEVTWSRPVIFQLVCEDCEDFLFCSLVQALCIDSEYCVSNEGKCLFNFKAKHLTHIFQKVRPVALLSSVVNNWPFHWELIIIRRSDVGELLWEWGHWAQSVPLQHVFPQCVTVRVGVHMCVCVCLRETELKSGPLYSTLSVLQSPWWVMLAWHQTELHVRQTDFIIKFNLNIVLFSMCFKDRIWCRVTKKYSGFNTTWVNQQHLWCSDR